MTRRALDPVLVAAIRETVEWIDGARYLQGHAAARKNWAVATNWRLDAEIASAVLDRLLSEAE